MENHHFDHQIILSMNISCCELCPRTLKKKLLNMPGVESVSIDMEKDLVIVTGTVEPMTLLNKVSKLGKKVRLLPNNGERRYRESQCGGRPHERKVDEEEEPHRCEPYDPPLIDERVCRDFFCKIHPRSRPMVNNVSGNGSFFGGWPFYSHGGGFGPYMDPMHEIMPPHFGYHQPPPQYWCHRPRPFIFDQF